MPLTETAWKDLLTAITAKNVIPIVGEGVVTSSGVVGGGPLATWLASRLAEELEISLTGSHAPTLNQVAVQHLRAGGRRQLLYARLKQILDEHEATLAPGQALLDLAAVEDFSLYVSTTCDHLLAAALNEVRHAGEPKTTVSVYHPSALAKDTPIPKSALPEGGAMVAQLLGRASAKPDFAVWDEDLLEFILGLHRDLQSDQMKHLAYDLQDNHLLLIGLRFSDWLTRFFVRVAEQKQLSDTHDRSRFLAFDADAVEPSMVIFFDSLRQETQVWDCSPLEFTRELRERWESRVGARVSRKPTVASGSLPPRSMPSNSIFLSYAREDFEAVKRFKECLEVHGCHPVWFDLERLQAGENWRNALELEVRKRCAVFVSCISRTTVAKIGELHRERSWAADTAPIFGDGATFYVPVILDDLRPSEVRREPLALFKENHVVSAHGGEVGEALALRLKELQAQNLR